MNTDNKQEQQRKFPESIRTLTAYIVALDAHDWNYSAHLANACKEPELEALHLCRFAAGQQQHIALLHATRYFDQTLLLFDDAQRKRQTTAFQPRSQPSKETT